MISNFVFLVIDFSSFDGLILKSVDISDLISIGLPPASVTIAE